VIVNSENPDPKKSLPAKKTGVTSGNTSPLNMSLNNNTKPIPVTTVTTPTTNSNIPTEHQSVVFQLNEHYDSPV
jgi:hypothetical protein